MTESRKSHTKIHEVKGGQRLVLNLLSQLVRTWQSTLSYESVGGSIEGLLRDNAQGSLLLLWHNRLFPGIGALNKVDMRNQRLHALVSASRDGAQLSYFIRKLGIVPIRGSSSRRASTAARECLKVLDNGDHIAITVDGPRGPCYEAQQGAAMLVQQTGAPVNFVGVECESCRVLNSWDKFIIPMPFSRVKIKLSHFQPDLKKEGKDERFALQMLIQERLMALTLDQHHQP